MKKLLAILLLLTGIAHAQPVQQSGTVTPGHPVRWITNGVVGDGGTAGNGLLTSLGVTYNGTGICQSSAGLSGAFNQLCLGTTTAGGGYLSFFNHGGTGGLFFNVNGTVYPFPFTGTGTVTSITAGTNITLTPNPCISSCTISATGGGGGGGSVTNVSGNNANGFTVGVTNQATTPVVTVGTSVNGYLLGNGTSVSAGTTTGTGSLVLATNPTIAGETVSGTANFTGTFQKSGNVMTFPASTATLGFLVGSVVSGDCLVAAGTAGGFTDSGVTGCSGGGGGGGGTNAHRNDYCITGTSGCTLFFNPGDTSVTLSSAPVNANTVWVTMDGVTQSGNTWSLSGSTINFVNPIAAKNVVDVTWLTTTIGIGTVTSVGFNDASSTPIFSISGSPVTASGVLTQTLQVQTANTIFSGPVSGGTAQPNFRALVGADLPNPGASSKGGVQSITSVASNWIAYIDTSGVPHQSQPTYTDLAAGAPTASSSVLGIVKGDGSTLTISGPGVISCTTSTISQLGCVKPDNSTITISAGTISAVGSSLTVGSAIVGSCTSGFVVYSNGGNVGCENLAGGGNVSNSGTPTIGQLAIWTNATTVEGVTALPSANMPTFTGDVTNSGLAMTVGKIGGNAVALGGALTFSGAFATTITVTAGTSVTIPTSGTLVNTGVTSLSSLATVGTIGTGTWQGTVVGATYGGTGINNGSNTLTLGGALTTTGAATPTLAFGTGSWTYTFAGTANDTVALLNKRDQTLAGGVNVTSFSIGTVSSGTTTIDCGNSPQQYLTNGGAFTLAAPISDGNCLVLITNNGSAGAITFSGFTAEASHGDSLTTTNTSNFTISVWRVHSVADYRVVAMQ